MGRRQLLLGGGGALVVASLGTWAVASRDEGRAAGAPADSALNGKEAPSLAQRVKAGTLPPLEERLPLKPLVVDPVDGLGVYGGTWRAVAVGVEDVTSWMLQTMYYDGVVAWDPVWKGKGALTDVVGNLAEEFTANEDGTEYTFTLREGIRWSDGEPFTADDIVFAVNQIQVNPDINASPPARFAGIDGSPCTAVKVDDRTAKITFPTPNALFLQGMCSGGGWVLAAPEHYLSQFIGPEGSSDWVEEFQAKNDPFRNAERPTLTAWMVTTAVSGGSRVVAQRNPYYWKTDPEGRQLPYLEEIVYSVVADPEVALAQALNGQVDLQSRTINTTRNKPVLAESRESGGYDFFQVQTGFMNTNLLMLNQNVADPVKREMFANKDFRIALSHAINRQELVDAIYAGQGEPWQCAPRPDSPYFDEEMAKQYVEYDVDAARAALDKAGYVDQGGQRIGPDGNPIQFTIMVASSRGDAVQSMDLVARYWREIGINASVDAVDETLFFERATAGSHDLAAATGDGGDNPVLYPYRFLPTSSRTSSFAPAWAKWFESVGVEGEAPPAAVQGWLEDYNRIRSTTDSDESLEIMTSLLRDVAEEFLVIGTTLPIPGYGIVSDTMHNIPASVPGDLTFPNVGAVHPEQFYLS